MNPAVSKNATMGGTTSVNFPPTGFPATIGFIPMGR
jgi:hypothetical protein